jgi:hypothetical protein
VQSLTELRETAIANLSRILTMRGDEANHKLLHAGPGGKAYTRAQVLEEMKRDPPTQEGVSLIRIWAMSDDEVQQEIKKARASASSR